MSTVEAPASHLPLPMQNILSRLAANSTEAEQALVRKAYAYAAAAHAGESVAGYIVNATRERMARDGFQPPPAPDDTPEE